MKLGLPPIDGVAINNIHGEWVGYATDLSGRIVSRSGFEAPLGAYTWARDERAKFAQGISAGAIMLDACLAEYEAKAKDDLTDDVTVGRCRQLVERLAAAGIRNVAAHDFRDRLAAWVKAMRNDWTYEKPEDSPYEVEDLSPRTRRAYGAMVATVIEAARLRKPSRFGIAINPAAKLDIGRVPEADRTPTFTIAEIRKMVTCDRGPEGGPWCADPWWLLLCALVYTGFRSTWAAHIRLEWFDFDQDCIRYDNTIKEIGSKHGKAAKGTAYLQPEFKEIVLAEIARRGMEPGQPGWLIETANMRSTGCINPRPRIKKPEDRTSEDAHSKAFLKTLERLGIPRITSDGRSRKTHSTRHTFIALHQGRGNADISRIQEWVGHRTRSMTTETYGTEAGEFAYSVKHWPEYRMCLRHAPDSAFHQPTKPAAVVAPEMKEMMDEMKVMRRMLARFLDAEAIVIPDA